MTLTNITKEEMDQMLTKIAAVGLLNDADAKFGEDDCYTVDGSKIQIRDVKDFPDDIVDVEGQSGDARIEMPGYVVEIFAIAPGIAYARVQLEGSPIDKGEVLEYIIDGGR